MAYLGTPIDTTNQFQSLQGKRFSGDGSTTAFTLDVAPSSVFDIEVFVENVRQDPNSAYGISGTTLTFTGAPSSGTNNIYVVHQAKAVGTIDVPASGVVPASLASNILTGQTDIGAAIADADLFLVDDGAGGTLRKTAASRLKTYIGDNTPAFRAEISENKTLSDASNTKIAFDSEDFDTDNCYDASSNYRFTPTVAGKYLIGTQIRMLSDNNSLLATTSVMIFKNGSEHVNSPTNFRNNQINGQSYHLSDIITFNGSSDYVEIYVNADVDSGGIIAAAGNTCTFFGYRIIGA
jgi:hypothetical protein